MSLNSEILNIVYHNVSNGIYVTDGQGITLGVNKPFEEMSGIRSEDIVNKSLYDLVHKYNVFSGSATILVLEKKTPITVTYHTKTDKKLLANGKPVFNEKGEIIYVINTVWDLTKISYKQDIDSDTAREHTLKSYEFVSCSPKMISILDLCMRVADTDSTIFLKGESGVGKGFLASIIHQAGSRKNSPFIKLNCAAIPENLIESELFGYLKGAFTGADTKGKKGLFEAADGGILFLDEISEMPLFTQSKLLGVLQDKEFTPLGGIKPRQADVRIIAASNKNLWQLVKEGKFREDLYYRLNVIPMEIPPLRQRPMDIAPLAEVFLKKYNNKYGTYKTFTGRVIERMECSAWYGNVRELENIVERLVVSADNDIIDIGSYESQTSADTYEPNGSLKSQIEAYERNILLNAARTHKSTRTLAKILKTSQASIVRKLNKHGISTNTDS